MNANALSVVASLLLLAIPSPDAHAQQMRGGEACKSEKVSSNPKMDFESAFNAADKRARAWQADVVIARLGHTSTGPIDPEGRSTSWNMSYYSPSVKQTDMITINNGMIHCWWIPGPAGRLPELKPNFYRDVKKILAEASAQGGAALMADGYLPMVELSAGARGQAFWYVNYGHPTKRHALQVTFDANTGAFNKAIK